MAVSQIDISNLALVELPASTIASINENSLSAIEARRCFGPVLMEFLEEFGYDMAITRAVLAQTSNARPAEWSFAYAVPDNMVFPLRLIPDFDATNGALVLLAGQSIAPVGGSLGPDPYRAPYVIAENILYCNEEAVTLEYVRDDPSITLFPPLMIRAMALEMAARMVMPILKSAKREEILMGKAELAKQRAIAANLNRKPTTHYLPTTEDERARDGWY
ncbi:MAG: hypothetical protein ACRCYS_11840 [Beijerinckiaceae bacterium]